MVDNKEKLSIVKVDENDLPKIIATQFDKLNKLEKKMQNAVTMAIGAKSKAEKACVSVSLFKKKEAIELLQDAAKGLAEAQISSADAQKLSFEYHSEVAEITKFLLGLGVSNIASNRSVVRELELRLKGAAEEDISDLAQQELRNVVFQLKSQEDIMKKQDDLTIKLKEQNGRIQNIDRQIVDIEVTKQEQDGRITENAEKIYKNASLLERHRSLLDEHTQRDKEIEEKLSTLSQCIFNDIGNLKNSIKEVEKANARFEEGLEAVSKELKCIDSQFKDELGIYKSDMENKIVELEKRLTAIDTVMRKKFWKISLSAITAASLLLNILHIVGII